jgi:hypothetical protein
MKKTLISFIGGVMVLTAVFSIASVVFAVEDNPSSGKPGRIPATITNTSANIASSTIKRVAKLDQVAARLQTRADQEIDRRIAGLNKLLARIQEMKKVSATAKNSFDLTVQAQINLLDNLKIKIGADADVVTLRADVQSITKAYRIYALILPQIEIVAASDRLASTSDLLSALAAKLQTRITTAQTGGKDVGALQTLLTDMNAKIADAKVQSAKAINNVSGLSPDNGDKTVMTSNVAALKAARDIVKTGTQDLKDANKDGQKILAGLKDLTKSDEATSTKNRE